MRWSKILGIGIVMLTLGLLVALGAFLITPMPISTAIAIGEVAALGWGGIKALAEIIKRGITWLMGRNQEPKQRYEHNSHRNHLQTAEKQAYVQARLEELEQRIDYLESIYLPSTSPKRSRFFNLPHTSDIGSSSVDDEEEGLRKRGKHPACIYTHPT